MDDDRPVSALAEGKQLLTELERRGISMSNFSSSATYGTVAGSSYGITVSPTKSDDKPKTPAGLIVTQAVQTKDGWLGQIIVDKTIVWESAPREDGDEGVQAANGQVVARLRRLFEEDPDSVDVPS